MRGIKDKLTAGVVVVVGMALIRTNAVPALWQMAMLGILFYETALLFIRAPRDHARRQIRQENNEINQANAAALKRRWIGDDWPMSEVM